MLSYISTSASKKENSSSDSFCCHFLRLVKGRHKRPGVLNLNGPQLFGYRDLFCGRQFFPWMGEGSLRMIQVHHIYRALYFYYYYISSTSYNQAVDSAVGVPCLKLLILSNYLEASVALFMAREKESNHTIYISYKQCAPWGQLPLLSSPKCGTSLNTQLLLSNMISRAHHCLGGHQVSSGMWWLTSCPCEGAQNGLCSLRQQKLVQAQIHQGLKPARKDIFNLGLNGQW